MFDQFQLRGLRKMVAQFGNTEVHRRTNTSGINQSSPTLGWSRGVNEHLVNTNDLVDAGHNKHRRPIGVIKVI